MRHMRISVQLLSQNDFSTEAYAVGVFNGQGLENELFFLSPDLASAVSAELKRREFQGKEGESCVLPLFQNKQVKHLIFIGLGKKRLLESQSVRSFTARAIKAANGVQAGELSFDPGLMDDLEDFSAGLQAAAEGLELAAYHFSVYKKRTAKEAVKKYKVESAVFYTRDKKNTLKSQKVLEWAKYIRKLFFWGVIWSTRLPCTCIPRKWSRWLKVWRLEVPVSHAKYLIKKPWPSWACTRLWPWARGRCMNPSLFI